MADEPSPLWKLQNADIARRFKVIPFPGRRGKPVDDGGEGWTVGMIPLGLDQLQSAHREAWDYLTIKLKCSLDWIDSHPDQLDAERRVQVLALALRDPENQVRPFGSAGDIRRLHPDESAALFTQFLAYQNELSPISRSKGFEEVEEQLAALGKGRTSSDFLLGYDTVSLASIVSELATRWTILLEAQPKSDSSSTSTSNPSSTDSTSGLEPGSSPSTGNDIDDRNAIEKLADAIRESGLVELFAKRMKTSL
jgi:hypothetical protein